MCEMKHATVVLPGPAALRAQHRCRWGLGTDSSETHLLIYPSYTDRAKMEEAAPACRTHGGSKIVQLLL
jgi:hypothetical protein